METKNERRPDLVLVHPGSRGQVYQSLSHELAAVEPPVWAGLIGAFMRTQGYGVEIVDGDAENLTPEEIAERVTRTNPWLTAVVAYGHQPSASTQTMSAAGEICRSIKDNDPTKKVLLVGGHVAALPERTLNEEVADYVCAGEGPYTLLDLVQALKSTEPEVLDKVRDLWFRQNGMLIRSSEYAPLVQDLDTWMRGIAWDLLPMDKYRAHNWHCFGDLKREPYASLYTTLGCPFKCSFCCIQAPFKSGERAMGTRESVNTYRYWSADTVLGEIDHLVQKYGVRNIKIADEMFVLNARHITGICEGIIERGYGLNMWAYARVDTIKGGMLEMLRKAGFNWLAFGLESGSDRVLAQVNKRFEQSEIRDTIAKVREAGISIIGNYIFGLPEDDSESMRETLRLALELRTEFANFYSAMAYPGSKLYLEALANGWELPKSWSGYSQHAVDTLPLPTKYLSAGEVLAFRDQAFHTYFTDQSYLEMIRGRFGQGTVDHLNDMTLHQLKRLYAAS